MRRALALAAAASLLSGCIATQRDVLALENQTDELKFQILELKKTIGSMQSNQADMIVEMKQLHSDLRDLHRDRQGPPGLHGQARLKIDGVGSGVANVGTGISTKVLRWASPSRRTEQQKKGRGEDRAQSRPGRVRAVSERALPQRRRQARQEGL